MGENTRIYNRFQDYTTEDCNCVYCLYYGGKRVGCTLIACCCMREWLNSLERGGCKLTPRKDVVYPWL
jgi:hypothetical protein